MLTCVGVVQEHIVYVIQVSLNSSPLSATISLVGSQDFRTGDTKLLVTTDVMGQHLRFTVLDRHIFATANMVEVDWLEDNEGYLGDLLFWMFLC